MNAQDTKIDSTQIKADSSLTDYQKLFKDKKVETAKGLITLYKIDENVYFELPRNLLGKMMLLGSVVVSSSDRGDAAAGEQGNSPMAIYFTVHDSTVYMRQANVGLKAAAGEPTLQNALQTNSLGPIIASFDVKAQSPDSSAIVFEPTDFFVDGNKAIDPFGPYAGNTSLILSLFGSKSTSFNSGNSMLVGINAFKNNITITSILSFDVSSTFMGLKSAGHRSTFKVKRSLMLLPDQTMKPRILDPRIAIESSQFARVSGTGNGIKPIQYAHRWQLVPAEKQAFTKGGSVSPRNPIIIYVDNEFPDKWMPYVLGGINDWNKAFAKIGFKNAIVIKMFDEGGAAFDPNNISYNTVNYIVGPQTNGRGMAWVDPRSGQILSASAYIYEGLINKMSDMLFVAMSPALPRARTLDMPDDLLGKAIRDVVAHQVGHMLGLADNLGASFSVPTESLRSPSFTQKYGITPSIMDNVYFNFVAQPGDVEKGVKWTRPNLGVYDYYAVKWLYSPIYEADSEQERAAILEKWVSNKVKNPMFRIHNKQISGVTDPAIPPVRRYDLGNNKIKATTYAFKNLEYILSHIDEWIGKEDVDFSFKSSMGPTIINLRFVWYFRHVLQNIGGVYQYANNAGDKFPAYEVVPEKVQRKSVAFLLDALRNLEWLNTPFNNSSIYADPAAFMRNVLVPYMLSLGMNDLSFTQQKAENPYTQTEFLTDIFEYVWAPVRAQKQSTPAEVEMQLDVLAWLINFKPIQADDKETGIQKSISTKSSYKIFSYLLQSEDLLEKAITLNEDKAKRKYQFMLLKLQKALDVDG